MMSWVGESNAPTLTVPEIDNYSASVAPRSVWFKNLPVGSKLLDIGAGNGMMSAFKGWPAYARQDIKMYALSLFEGEHFAKYDGFELGNFEAQLPQFGDVNFNALLCAHFIEHLKDPERCIRWMSSRLSKNGKLYIEWPHSVSKRLPRNTIFKEKGLNVTTTNFFDDGTHVETWEMDFLANLLTKHGFVIQSAGRVCLPFLATQMKDHAKVSNNSVHSTFAVWFYTGWPQYLVAEKA
jgi:2-polyprenyl-3-methyl-5-hydroxy-6-metoxy-1,4-benzoquinol methylase